MIMSQENLQNTAIEATIKQKHYSTETAHLIAGSLEVQITPDNMKALYRTDNGNYFLVLQGRADYILPIDQKEALDIWDDDFQNLIGTQHRATFADAFPGLPVQEA